MPPSRFIHAMHPKTEIRADRLSIQKVLHEGWVGQQKIHGHRAQIHLSADENEPPLVYTRHGQPHKLPLVPAIVAELRRVFGPKKDWSVIDTEWLKPEKKIYVFDFLRKEGESLQRLTFPERWAMLPKDFLSPHLKVLPVLDTLEKCLKVLELSDEKSEGLVFKSTERPGFEDTSIIRCRRKT